MSDALYHISDQPDIQRFEPRPAPRSDQKGEMVWAVDRDHLHNYFLPRDCPRVTFYALPTSRPEDIERLMDVSTAKYIVAMESRWFQEALSHRLYQYELPPDTFTCVDEGAGYYVSREAVVPHSVMPITDLLGTLVQHDVELRVMPSLWKLRDAVIASTLQFSIIRMRNAAPPEAGLTVQYPLPERRRGNLGDASA